MCHRPLRCPVRQMRSRNTDLNVSSSTSSDSESNAENYGAVTNDEPDRDEDDGNLRDQPVDPIEPDHDGEDLSDVQLSSGSTFDPETEDDSDGDDSGPESELEDSEEDGGDEEY
ncbi:hypothetical protein DFH08DRAFT_946055, partial [Mycena albidolilacea]